MIRDNEAHNRITAVEAELRSHKEDHAKFEASLIENTNLTKSIEVNTRELVTLFKGASSVRTFFVWASPIVAFIAGGWTFINWLIGRN